MLRWAFVMSDVYWAQQHALAGKPWRLVNEAAVAPFDIAVEVDGQCVPRAS